MECRYAYVKQGVNYVLCKCQGEPNSAKMQDITRCMCGHQRFCPQIQHCTLLPSWQHCAVKNQAEKKMSGIFTEIVEPEVITEPEVEIEPKAEATPEEEIKPKRSSRKKKQ